MQRGTTPQAGRQGQATEGKAKQQSVLSKAKFSFDLSPVEAMPQRRHGACAQECKLQMLQVVIGKADRRWPVAQKGGGNLLRNMN